MVASDLNKDGRADLTAVALSGKEVAVYLSGPGGAPAMKRTVVPKMTWGVAIADFDLNGTRDIAALDGDPLDIAPGLGDGTFGGLIPVPGGSGTLISSFDCNRDDLADLAIADMSNGAVFVLPNTSR